MTAFLMEDTQLAGVTTGSPKCDTCGALGVCIVVWAWEVGSGFCTLLTDRAKPRPALVLPSDLHLVPEPFYRPVDVQVEVPDVDLTEACLDLLHAI